VKIIKRFLFCARGTAAVEAAIFLPIFLSLTLGVTDLGSGMFVRMTANAAVQAGAAYAVINSCTSSCLANIKAAMNDAAGNPNPAFCTVATCTTSMTTPCVAPCVITISVNYPYSPILPYAVYAWAQPMTVSSTATVRVQ
jgi:Flp pilus assembly protein TadG